MILASKNGLMCVVTLLRETPKAWVVQHAGEKKHETRIPKSSGRMLFHTVHGALDWIGVDWE